MPDPCLPGLVAIDWGTTSLRAHLLDTRGGMLETRARPWGIQHLPDGGYQAAFRGIAGDWLGRFAGLPAIAAGMVGSRNGWREVPYVGCPADATTIAAGLLVCDTGSVPLHLVPGVLQPGGLPDVMRGEETQVLGALTVDPALASNSRLVLPGTHSKWVTVRDGRIVAFASFMTGELFAVLREHSILGRPARETSTPPDPAGGAEAFGRGLEVARDSGAAGVAGRLFTARSLFLTGDLAPQATLDYLSGLLIGEELRSGLAAIDATRLSRDPPRIAVIGTEALCDRYRTAFKVFGVDDVQSCGDTSAAGLWQVATAAGLVSNAIEGMPGPRGPLSETHASGE
jgi:2-dehydro-3-deoxygalactonokinase